MYRLLVPLWVFDSCGLPSRNCSRTWYLLDTFFVFALTRLGGTYNCERRSHSGTVGEQMCRYLRHPRLAPPPASYRLTVLPPTQDHEDSGGSDGGGGGGGRGRSALVQLQFHSSWGRVTPAKKPSK